MNDTLQLLHDHRSDRAFTGEGVPDAQLDAIVEAAHRAPNFFNGQQISLVVVRDAERRQRISALTGGQAAIAKAPVFITVVIDFHKTALGVQLAGGSQVIHESVEGFAVGAVDAGIAVASLIVAARSLGLGAVPIGGIRKDPQALIDLLELPRLTFPIAGVALGPIAQQAPQKPRLPLSSFRHDEHYRAQGLQDDIRAYDRTLEDYWRALGRPEGKTWSQAALRYTKVYFPETRAATLRQGFTLDK
ncbi:NADPH-dependent oxidoreductase [Xylophilus sp.]|uniref:NADPH-dependent oxidoreductase n=1 Tax=Xylophilus sp. TaxID=2653893 RepID=UPI0013BE06C7|nr:NADPH-dependent oxidoreductase [Xylophilus sp.]KAF1044923.1 MAG: FMN reductase [NAD(P)H] [Xylophilus sp.]